MACRKQGSVVDISSSADLFYYQTNYVNVRISVILQRSGDDVESKPAGTSLDLPSKLAAMVVSHFVWECRLADGGWWNKAGH